jgi:hypothetical protein
MRQCIQLEVKATKMKKTPFIPSGAHFYMERNKYANKYKFQCNVLSIMTEEQS